MKHFFEQDAAIGEIEVPDRNYFLTLSKKVAKGAKITAKIDLINDEYLLQINDDKEKSTILNINDLRLCQNKCNLIIPNAPYTDAIFCTQFKSKGIIINDLNEISNGIKKLSHNDNNKVKQGIFSPCRSESIQRTESSDSEFKEVQQIELPHKEILKNQSNNKIGLSNQNQNNDVDRTQIERELKDFLRLKGQNGSSIQDIRSNRSFSMCTENFLKDILKNFTDKCKRSSRVYYVLKSTLM